MHRRDGERRPVPAKIDRQAPEPVGQPAGDRRRARTSRTCAPLMTMPDRRRAPWPCSVMWSGVIVMIRTMTTWPMTSATIATGTCGRAQDRARATPAMDASCVAARSVRGRRRRAAYGSGRRSDEATGSRRRPRRRSARGTGRRARAGRSTSAKAPGRRARGSVRRSRRPSRPTRRGRCAEARRCSGYEVRGRVARQLVRGVAEPDEERPEEQQRQRHADDRDRSR